MSLVDSYSENNELIEIPIRGLFCSHIEVFCLRGFLETPDKSKNCPFCNKFCPYLVLDQYVMEILKGNSEKMTEVILNGEGEVVKMSGIKGNIKPER